MLQIIGLIVAAYTMTRLLDMATSPARHAAVKLFSILAMILTGLLVAALLMSSQSRP
jgi:hypothetical protein